MLVFGIKVGVLVGEEGEEKKEKKLKVEKRRGGVM